MNESRYYIIYHYRPKLSLLQQLVDILQSLHKVIKSPKKLIDMTNDEIKSADKDDENEEDSSLTMEDRIEVKRHYKLICYRLAISCSLKLRKHRLTCAESGENGRYK